MSTQKLLNIDPQLLAFRFELGRQASCRIKICNNSQGHVAFKVLTTSPQRYGARPNVGVLKPKSCLEIKVIMQGPTEIPYNMECNDTFLIRSAVATPNHTPENAHELFKEEVLADEGCSLKVVYVTPTRSERSVPRSTSASTSQHGHGRNAIDVVDWLKKGIAIVLLCLIVGFLAMKILPLIWSLTFMMTVLVVKLGKKFFSDNAEEWILKIILAFGVHIFSTVFGRGGAN
ncbi:hypothetical protein ABFS83_01G089900 [Erythranthe nasuta]